MIAETPRDGDEFIEAADKIGIGLDEHPEFLLDLGHLTLDLP